MVETSTSSPGPGPGTAQLASPTPTAPVPTRAELRAQRQRAKPRLWRRKLFWILLVVVLVLTAGGLAGARLATYAERSAVKLRLGPAPVLAQAASPLPWPASGEAAVSVPALGIAESGPAQQPVPVASLTKLMTAYVVLSDHPLPDGDDGPSITLDLADAAEAIGDGSSDASYLPVQPGEVLTERQLLQGMLVHSADNFADVLATFDAGSVGAFVAKMNQAASALGLAHTHFADANGLNPGSTSTPADLLQLAATDLKIPAFAEAVTLTSVTVPGGTFATFTPLLAGTPGGVPDVVGVKSGFTSAAGGCDVMAYRATVGSRPLLVLAAVLGQPGLRPLPVAGAAALRLVQAVATQLRPVQLARAGERVGRVTVSTAASPVVEASAASAVDWPGWRLERSLTVTRRPLAGSPPAAVGRATFTLGPQRVTVVLRMVRGLPEPGIFQRLFGGNG